MTMPHLMNCQHCASGWCLSCVKKMQDEFQCEKDHNAALVRQFQRASASASKVEQQRDKLQAFKDWVHKYLDDHGVPHHPPGTHGEHGCRIGDRMDWLIAKIKKLEEALQPFAEMARAFHETGIMRQPKLKAYNDAASAIGMEL